MVKSVLCLVLSLSPLPAVAQEGLDTLVPLVELYGPNGSSPAFDVAGIRCAGLYGAQERWGRQDRAARPTQAQMEAFQSNLDAAQQERVNGGMGFATARESVAEDLYRVIDLYVAVFAENDRRGLRWDAGALMDGDRFYCDALNRR